jgi:lysozyme
MTPSQNCFDFIAKEEGLVLTAYQDAANIWTIGYGSTMFKDGSRPKKGEKITKELAMDLLKWEVENKTHSVNAFFRNVVLNQNQFDALVSFAYNCGVGALEGSSLRKAIIQDPKVPGTKKVFEIGDESIRKWMEAQQIRAIPMVTYYFSMYCKITINDKKHLLDDLIRRRLREAKHVSIMIIIFLISS